MHTTTGTYCIGRASLACGLVFFNPGFFSPSPFESSYSVSLTHSNIEKEKEKQVPSKPNDPIEYNSRNQTASTMISITRTAAVSLLMMMTANASDDNMDSNVYEDVIAQHVPTRIVVDFSMNYENGYDVETENDKNCFFDLESSELYSVEPLVEEQSCRGVEMEISLTDIETKPRDYDGFWLHLPNDDTKPFYVKEILELVVGDGDHDYATDCFLYDSSEDENLVDHVGDDSAMVIPADASVAFDGESETCDDLITVEGDGLEGKESFLVQPGYWYKIAFSTSINGFMVTAYQTETKPIYLTAVPYDDENGVMAEEAVYMG